MRYILDSSIKKTLQNLCRHHGFISRGQVFFRINGKNVLQAIGFRHERVFDHYALNIGLMSLYSEAEDSLLSSQSALPKYSICCLNNCANAVSIFKEHEFASFSVRSPQDQLSILDEKGFEWLDEVATQNCLLDAMDILDNISYKSTIWNDEMKLAPFLAVKDYCSADMVIASILNQQLGPNSFSPAPWTREDFLYYSTHYPGRNEKLLFLHKLITDERYESIDAYLNEQYCRNATRLRFLKM